MTQTDMRAVFLEELTRVAPDIDPAGVSDGDHLQDDLELDSMDILNLVAALHQRLGIEIPEADYPRIATAGAAAAYLSAAAAAD
ncbi:acyl carrier protein [Leisingera aquaemixtae]|jgi:acyl carrier protein|uniref:Acyl carrier protein n=1 Tax=Leisingera aquaemixtae TaxID=1396826 RepID=A0A0P1H5V0_9RHOB|nr:acyl carrier protein [Leisingera aquaemixtae]QDI74562.1 acyl carrier protein [Leisingera aquaemixtae]UWQ27146.1 acyl carrier protein [Leisingera aquaemixtae]UWQ39796.1 acyl carrier protein [Leisingera aquaemixtae]UWQ43928.1 acyl carrier protein [Leisingera aquaemixtae]CUH98291.1 Acyl carrier protein [Leisingera aquaemixtae]